MKPYSILGLFALTAVSVQGAIAIATDFKASPLGESTLNHGYTPSTTDLINGKDPLVSTGVFNANGGGGTAVLTDGGFPIISRNNPIGDEDPSTPASHNGAEFTIGDFAEAGNGAGTSVTYSFDTAVSISSIDVYGGWQDDGRNQQRYRIFYTTTLSPVFIELSGGAYAPTTTSLVDDVLVTTVGGINYDPPGNTIPNAVSGGYPIATKVSISDSTGTLIENVTAIRFEFGDTENGFSGYSEIDIFAVPEPSSAALLGLGMLGFLRRRR